MRSLISIYLVGGLEQCSFFHILGIMIPTDELRLFRRGRYTTNQIYIYIHPERKTTVFHETFMMLNRWIEPPPRDFPATELVYGGSLPYESLVTTEGNDR